MDFAKELQQLINRHNMEAGSGTPDFILAQYIKACLSTFDLITNARDDWHKLNNQAETQMFGGVLPLDDGRLLGTKLFAIHSHAEIEAGINTDQIVYRESDVIALLKEYGFAEPEFGV